MAVCLCSEIFMSLFARFSKELGLSAGLKGPHTRRTCGYSAHWKSINCHILPYFDSISRKTLHATSLVFIAAAANMAVNPQTNSQQNSTTITFSLIRSEGLAFKTFHEFGPITSKSWIINILKDVYFWAWQQCNTGQDWPLGLWCIESQGTLGIPLGLDTTLRPSRQFSRHSTSLPWSCWQLDILNLYEYLHPEYVGGK